MAGTDDAINEIVHAAAEHVAKLCGNDPDAVVMVCFGLLGHCVDCFGLNNEDAHSALATILAQRSKP